MYVHLGQEIITPQITMVLWSNDFKFDGNGFAYAKDVELVFNKVAKYLGVSLPRRNYQHPHVAYPLDEIKRTILAIEKITKIEGLLPLVQSFPDNPEHGPLAFGSFQALTALLQTVVPIAKLQMDQRIKLEAELKEQKIIEEKSALKAQVQREFEAAQRGKEITTKLMKKVPETRAREITAELMEKVTEPPKKATKILGWIAMGTGAIAIFGDLKRLKR